MEFTIGGLVRLNAPQALDAADPYFDGTVAESLQCSKCSGTVVLHRVAASGAYWQHYGDRLIAQSPIPQGMMPLDDLVTQMLRIAHPNANSAVR